MEQRLQHRIACKSKSKLSLGQKLEIVAQHQSRDPAIRKTQVSFAPLMPTHSAPMPTHSDVMYPRARPRNLSGRPTLLGRYARVALQAQLAILYGKSRSAISKILRPENISKLKDNSATGVHKGTLYL